MNRRTLLKRGTGLAAVAAWTAACDGEAGPAAGPTGSGSPTRPVPSRPTLGGNGSTRPPGTAIPWNALAQGLGGSLLRPGDSDWTTARRLYNTRFDALRPAAVAYVDGPDDVRECLAFARRHGTPVSVRGGGHSYAGWSSGDGRLVVDVSRLSRIGRPGSEVAVGAGARLIDVYRSLARHGRTVPAGSCPTVGIAGLALGGGHGVVSRAYGLTCDSLTGATLVTADGRTLRTSATEHPDLFWALRGAGNAQFGVVTELRFRTHPAPDAVSGNLTWPWSRAREVVAAWQEWGPSQPDEIWSALHLSADPGGPPRLSVSVCSLGTYGGLRNAVDRLATRTGAAASGVSLRRLSHAEAMDRYAGCASLDEERCRLPGRTPGRGPRGALERETYAARSAFFDRSLSAAGIHTLLNRVESFTGPALGRGDQCSVALTALGGAVNRISPGATAFVHRRSRMLAQYLVSWQPGTPGTAGTAWLAATHDAMRRHASGAAYQNYTDPALTDWRTAYYGANAPRLAVVKRKYDPDRFFTFPQAL
ncbi:FAD-binding oxidoreductase [Streptomyces sp. GC420]|uniref:FAD-binding oxidoreductase n=1 Tax=Streptomyces sp. GC420 TaxID=2697568 RepID=UPI0014151A8F|nr:FAD-dependent oxidoreductase [Streptomyces sp. GC420]NBM17344.1 FAD-binding protein [Streptomyces sp. GC420]